MPQQPASFFAVSVERASAARGRLSTGRGAR